MGRRCYAAALCLSALLSPFVFTTEALASTGGGAPLPWEWPIRVISDSLRGPVATSVSVIALVVACFLLMTRDMGDGAKRIVQVIVAFATVSSAYGLLSLFGVVSALA